VLLNIKFLLFVSVTVAELRKPGSLCRVFHQCGEHLHPSQRQVRFTSAGLDVPIPTDLQDRWSQLAIEVFVLDGSGTLYHCVWAFCLLIDAFISERGERERERERS